MEADLGALLDRTTRTVSPSRSLECLTEDAVRRRFEGLLGGAAVQEQERHLDECDICRAMVDRLAPSPIDSPLVEMGRMGRFEVLEPLGQGGMGQVYRAYDPQLEREVAIKLLGAKTSAKEHARLLREAQALAQINHPNILPIYDIGPVAGGAPGSIYLAVQLVRGQNLRQWLNAKPRSTAQILRCFIAAGHGLQAAHDVDLVHRDFKPANVMVGDDDRCLVMDFGLARRVGTTAGSGVRSVEPEPLVVDEWVTEAGAILGTPAYMAPEQHRGRMADPRADQFSFCVALWEALLGQHPFGETNVRKTVLRAELRPPPAEHTVPAPIIEALRRGLAVDPTARHPSMRALLGELHTEPRSTARWLGAGLGALCIGALGVLAWPPEGVAPSCDGEARMAEVWDEARQARVRDAFAAITLPLARSTQPVVADHLDDYRDRWVETYTELCRTTPRSTAKRDRGMACLNDRRDAMDRLLDVLEDTTPTVVQRAPQAVLTLPSVQTCLAAEDPAITDPASGPRAVESMLAEVAVLMAAGLTEAGRARAEDAAMEAFALGHPPVMARARLTQGNVASELAQLERSAPLFEEALEIASANDLHRVAANASIGLAILARKRGDFGASERWLRHADAAVTRSGTPANLEANVLLLQGRLSMAQGDYERARSLMERALTLTIQHHGPRSLATAHAYMFLARLAKQQQRYDEAQRLFHQVLELEQELLGPMSPDITITLGAIENTYLAQGDLARARELGADLISRLEAAYGPRHPTVVSAVVNHSALLTSEGRYQQSLEYLDRGLALAQQLEGFDPGMLGTIHSNRGMVLGYLGRADEAVATMRTALRLAEDREVEDPLLASALDNLGYALTEASRAEEALPHHRRALALWERLVPGSVSVAISLTDHSRALVASGQAAGAIPLARRAVTIFEEKEVDPFELARAREVLARALVASGGDVARARALASEAREGYAGDVLRGPRQVRDLDAWLQTIE